MMLLISRKWLSSAWPEFFAARDVDEMVELFPALDVGFDLSDQLVELFGGHRRGGLASANKAVCGSRKMTAPPRSSRAVMLQAGEMDADFGQRHLRHARLAEEGQHFAARCRAATPSDRRTRRCR